MEPVFFTTPSDFRRWLEQHHEREQQLIVGFYKKGSGRPSITWPESVDQALCFGWIDGVRRGIDDASYSIRFTRRRFRANAKAWEYFEDQPPWYRKAATWWVISAKREETRARRLSTLIEESESGRTVPPLTRPGKRK